MSTSTNARVVVYLQTLQNLNLLPQCCSNLTAINLSSFHFGYNKDGSPYIHLNDNDPDDPMYNTLWPQLQQAQQGGVKLVAMLGGAGGAYTQLFNNYTTFYPMWVKMLQAYNFDGVDLDVEEPVTIANLQMFINDLRRDFPTDFLITAAPVALALKTGYDPLAGGINWATVKAQIDWFNVQFYSGYGSLATVNDYVSIINMGYSPNQILGGALTNPANGHGYVPIITVCNTLSALNTRYKGQLGGAMGWEFYNANNTGEKNDPVGWASAMKLAV
jgi:chitinase